MKTLKISFVLLLSLFMFASCSKKEDAVNPDSGAEVAGTYTVTKIRLDNGNTGTVQAGYTKKIYLIRLSESEVDITIELGEPNKPTEKLHSNDAIKLQRSGQTISLLTTDGSPLGTYTGGTLELKVKDNTGQIGTFIANK